MHRLISRTPLRIKLVAAVLALVTAALLVIGVASAFALRSYLLSQIDTQLATTAQRVNHLNHRPNAGELPTSILVGQQGAGGWDVTVYDPDYQDRGRLPSFPSTLAASEAKAGKPYIDQSPDGSTRWRVLIVARQSNATMTMVAEDMSTMDHAVDRLVVAELLVGFGVLILLAVLGAALVRASLGTLREIEHTAQAIAAGDLTRRVPEFEPGGEEPRTEVGRLGRALNAMLVQIEAAFTARAESEARALRSEERMREFVADASHELRTPLTTIRGFAELYRQGAVRSPDEVDRLIRRIEDEASRMGLLVEDLLLLARLDQERPLVRAPLELRVIANDAVTAARAVAPDRTIQLEIPEGTGPLIVSGDEARLRQVVDNLVANALTHTPAGTPVWLRLYAEDGSVVVEVADAGPGLRPEQADRVFERFYRADAARTRRNSAAPTARSGTGLGLAIVAALVAAHEGTVQVDSPPGGGAVFRVRLPAAPAALVASEA
jgi:two-component system OmpR family sensor kinase